MNSAILFKDNLVVKNVLIDLAALTFIYFVPAISHLVGIPIYLLEPMRIMLIVAMVHSSRKNAYLIALTLPVFSFVISAHPSLLKTGIITIELLLNVWLFFKLSQFMNNKFFVMFTSIIASKLIYYALKFSLISFVLLESQLISTPIYLQLIVTLVLSFYIFFIDRRNSSI